MPLPKRVRNSHKRHRTREGLPSTFFIVFKKRTRSGIAPLGVWKAVITRIYSETLTRVCPAPTQGPPKTSKLSAALSLTWRPPTFSRLLPHTKGARKEKQSLIYRQNEWKDNNKVTVLSTRKKFRGRKKNREKKKRGTLPLNRVQAQGRPTQNSITKKSSSWLHYDTTIGCKNLLNEWLWRPHFLFSLLFLIH